MVRKFEVGGVCMAFNEVEEDPELVKVLRVSADEKTVWFRTNVKEGELVEAKLDADGDAVFFFDVPEDDKAAYENPDKPGFKDMEMAVSANASGRSRTSRFFSQMNKAASTFSTHSSQARSTSMGAVSLTCISTRRS